MRHHRVHGLFLSLSLSFLIGAVLGTAGPSSAACGGGPCSCGSLVDSNTILSAATDPVCFTGPTDVACPNRGLSVAAGITLDLGGCTIRGTGSDTGIFASAGATVRNGRVTDFGLFGVSLSGNKGLLANLLITGNGNGLDGVQVAGDGNRLQSVAVHGQWQRSCIIVFGNANAVSRAQTSDCGGVILVGNGSTVERSTVRDSAGIGITAFGDENTIAANRIDDSAQYGLAVSSGSGSVVTRNIVSGSGFCGVLVESTTTNVVADANRSQGAVTAGFCVDGAGSTLSRNVANANEGDGFRVNGSGQIFDLNRSTNNGGFGIQDFTSGGGTGGTDNTYTRNVCSGNDAGDSSPAGLCS